jgi:CPA1 family monovalent cation:H+ antiporter
MTLPLVLAAVAVLLVIIALIQPLASRLQLPPSVLLAAVGILIGATAAYLLYTPLTDTFNEVARAFVDLPVSSETFLYVFLPALLFQTSLTLDVRRMAEDAAPVLLLAVVAVLLATIFIGYSVAWISEQPLVVCLLLGAIVATTDPVAVVGIFRELGAPARLTRLVEGESLLNDAAAITLFVLLLDLLISGRASSFPEALMAFATKGIGGAVVGYAAGRVTASLFRVVRESPAAIVTISVALPYLVFIGCEELHLSGVVAVVGAGIAINLNGPTRVPPDAWRYLREIWEQLEFWSASLIFVLASLLVPRLLGDVELWELLPLVVLIVAAFASRALTLFGLLPLLTLVRLSAVVDNKFKVVILWGGLRGAVTLALALAVTENRLVPAEVQRFIATTAAGYTLFTLLVSGTTLRPLIRLLKLDQLSPFDRALRDSGLALALRNVRDAVKRTAESTEMPTGLTDDVVGRYDRRVAEVLERVGADDGVLDRDRITFALVALADRERALLQQHFRRRTVSIRIIERLLAETGQLRERARAGGRVEYNRAARRMIGYSLGFRLALRVHRVVRYDGFLVEALADRFERLLILRIMLGELAPFIPDRIAPALGHRVAEIVEDILTQRREATKRALEALELQYPDYSLELERRFLLRTGLRREELEYETLFADRLINAEVLHDLERDIAQARAATETRPTLDLRLNTRELVAHFPLFHSLNDKQIERVSRLLRPRFAVPGERLIRRGERGDSVYFVSSGAVEVSTPTGPIRLGRGDFIGELAILTGARRNADVTAIAYCQLLVLNADDFRALIDKNPDIAAEVDRVAAIRLGRIMAQPADVGASEAADGVAAQQDERARDPDDVETERDELTPAEAVALVDLMGPPLELPASVEPESAPPIAPAEAPAATGFARTAALGTIAPDAPPPPEKKPLEGDLR